MNIEGRNAVAEAVKSGTEIEKIFVSVQEGSIKQIIGMAKERGIIIMDVHRAKLDEMSETGAHQGIIAVASAHEYASVDEILQRAYDKGEKPFIVILDEITDPHNLGAILRTANAAGVHGIIIPKRNSVGLTSTVAKVSSGAIEYTPVAKVANLPQLVDRLKNEGIWFYGSHQDAKESYKKPDYSGGVGLIIGSEGKGISRLLLEKCDFLVSIPMLGEITSLNASVAAGILMYEIAQSRAQSAECIL